MHKKLEAVIHKILSVLELLIAVLTLIVLVGTLAIEVYHMFTVAEYYTSLDDFLHAVLTIVVGLEFVRMLIDMTPGNTIDVLVVAIARQVILYHDNALSNLAAVACIAGLFAVRRFLIPKKQAEAELTEIN